MKPDLPERTQALFDKLKDFPEAGKHRDGMILSTDAYVSFLDMRKLVENEILGALHELRQEKREWFTPPRMENE